MQRKVGLVALVLFGWGCLGSCRHEQVSGVRREEPVALGPAMSRGRAYTNTVGMEMVRIEPGVFLMGEASSVAGWDEQPVHQVTISRPFYMSETEVTVRQFRQFRPDFKGTEEYSPYVGGVSWYDAKAFCEWLSRKEGRPYRLPTEAEWEYACRAGTETPFSFSPVSVDNILKEELKVSGANPWGLKNMHTGVREWCLDWHGQYPDTEQVDPVGPERGMVRVVRGGGLDRFYAQFARSANRSAIAPGFGPGRRSREAADRAGGLPAHRFKPGLVGTLFNSNCLQKPRKQEIICQVNFDWDKKDSRGSKWSGRWRGYIEGPVTGEVTFHAEGDNGLMLSIDEQVVIAGWGRGGSRTSKIEMVRGRKYPLVLSYYNERSRSYLRLYWSWRGQEKIIVPAEAFWHTFVEEGIAERERSQTQDPGYHPIGLRVVQAPMPTTKALACDPPFARRCVKQNAEMTGHGSNPNRPYFRKRYILPIPPENTPREAILAAGLHPAFLKHNHSPALEVCPNGDVLAVYFTSEAEYGARVALMGTRLRFGAEQWDMPSLFLDFVDAADDSPMLWNDNGTVHLFWGNPETMGAYPFQWCSSKDNGASFGEINFPVFRGPVGDHWRQPINSAFRGCDGTMYMACDGKGATSVLWASSDNGRTWYDPGGRSGGRHTTFVLLKDGGILGIGGKHASIEGFNTKSVSRDGGRSWKVSKTEFPALGSNQRPSLIRLASGRLLYASDFQSIGGGQPEGITERGAFVALSDDEGGTWRIKKLVGAEPHESTGKDWGTIGYSVARQGPNGVIHLITSMNRPSLHFEFNEAWVLDEGDEEKSDAELMRSSASRVSNVRRCQERYPSGKLKATWGGGIGDDGRFLLDGTEVWYYENGGKEWEVTYKLGRKVGVETHWSPEGKKRWQRRHGEDGTSVWTQWWSNGRKKAESSWRNFKCEGAAVRWDRDGDVVSKVNFVEGFPSE